MDGSGYPDGLRGDKAHPFARITAVADVYDAITSDRVYEKQKPHIKALAMIAAEDKRFDPEVMDALIQIVLRNETLIERFRSEYLSRSSKDSTALADSDLSPEESLEELKKQPLA